MPPNEEQYATYCPDCEVIIGPDEEGFDSEICIECGGCDCYEVPY